MREYIEKELLKEQFLKWLPPDGDWDYVSMGLHPIENIAVSAIMEIEETPAADVREVIHATWIGKPIAGYSTVRCSNCKSIFRENNGRWKYCPDCGAKMDKLIKEKF